MTVQELINRLEKIKDKSKEVQYYYGGYYEDVEVAREEKDSVVIL